MTLARDAAKKCATEQQLLVQVRGVDYIYLAKHTVRDVWLRMPGKTYYPTSQNFIKRLADQVKENANLRQSIENRRKKNKAMIVLAGALLCADCNKPPQSIWRCGCCDA